MGQELMRFDVFAESMQEAERCLRGFGCDWSLLGRAPHPSSSDNESTDVDLLR